MFTSEKRTRKCNYLRDTQILVPVSLLSLSAREITTPTQGKFATCFETKGTE